MEGLQITDRDARHAHVMLEDEQLVLLRPRLVSGEPPSLCQVPLSVLVHYCRYNFLRL